MDMKEGMSMKSVSLKNQEYSLFIDIIKKEFILSKRNRLHLQTQRIIPFTIIKKISLVFNKEEKTIAFTFHLKKYDPYTLTLSLNSMNNNDFTVFLILLKNSHLLIEDQAHIIDTFLKNDVDLENF